MRSQASSAWRLDGGAEDSHGRSPSLQVSVCWSGLTLTGGSAELTRHPWLMQDWQPGLQAQGRWQGQEAEGHGHSGQHT